MIPEWLKRLPDDAYLNANEVKKLFGFSEKTTLHSLRKRKRIPEPDSETRRIRFKYQTKPLWSVRKVKEILNGTSAHN